MKTSLTFLLTLLSVSTVQAATFLDDDFLGIFKGVQQVISAGKADKFREVELRVSHKHIHIRRAWPTGTHEQDLDISKFSPAHKELLEIFEKPKSVEKFVLIQQNPKDVHSFAILFIKMDGQVHAAILDHGKDSVVDAITLFSPQQIINGAYNKMIKTAREFYGHDYFLITLSTPNNLCRELFAVPGINVNVSAEL